MTVAQATTTTIYNGINSFISLQDMVDRLIEYRDENYILCELTEVYVHIDEAEAIDYIDRRNRHIPIQVHPDALNNLSQCQCCDYYLHEDAEIVVGYSDVICQSCYEDQYFTCDSCHEIIHNDSYGSDGYCESCHRDNDCRQFGHYRTRRGERFTDYKLNHTGRHHHVLTPSELGYAIGIEVEAYGDHEDERDFNRDQENFADVLGEAVHEVWSLKSIFYAPHTTVLSYKDDSSLQEDDDRTTRASFEMDIQPLRIETWRTVWTKPEVLAAYAQLVKRTTNRCGLHISIGANQFSSLRIFNMVNRLMSALEENEEKAKKILGRKPSAYGNNSCQTHVSLKEIWNAGGHKTGPLALRKKPYIPLDVNSIHTDDTQSRLQGRFEYRAFRAPMQPDLILRRIEYAVSMTEWAKTAPISIALNDEAMIEHFEQFHAGRLATITK